MAFVATHRTGATVTLALTTELPLLSVGDRKS